MPTGEGVHGSVWVTFGARAYADEDGVTWRRRGFRVAFLGWGARVEGGKVYGVVAGVLDDAPVFGEDGAEGGVVAGGGRDVKLFGVLVVAGAAREGALDGLDGWPVAVVVSDAEKVAGA